MKNNRVNAIISAMAVAIMLSAAVVPFLVSEEADESEAGVNHVPGFDPVHDFFVGAGIVSEISAKVFNYLAGEDWDGTVDDVDSTVSEEVHRFARQTACIYTTESLTILSNTCNTLVDNMNQALPLTESYLSRATEIAAASMWSRGAVYDADSVIEDASVYSLLANILYNTSYAVDFAMRNIGDRVGTWSGSSVYNGIDTRISWDSGNTAVASRHASIMFSNIIKATQSANLVFVPEMDSGGMTIWALSGPGTLSPKDGGAPIELSSGKNVLTSDTLPSGWYALSQGTYGGILMPSTGQSSADVSGGAIIVVDDDVGFVTVRDNALIVNWGGVEQSSSTLRYMYTADGQTYYSDVTSGDDFDPIGDLLCKWSMQIRAVKNLLYTCSVAGQTMWTVAAAAGEANLLLSPSSISPQLVGMGIDAHQSYALYIAALSQISQYYQAHGTQLKADDTQISAQSLSLYCFGTLYNADGSVIASDVVFTPYVYVDNMVVKVSALQPYNTMNQDGTIMIWSKSSSSLADFLASDPDAQTVVVMPKNAYFSVDEMKYNDISTDQIILKVKTVSQTEGFEDIFHRTIDPPKVLEASTLVMIIMLELAVIFVLLGWAAKMPLLFLIAGIVVVVALVFPEAIARVLVGAIGR